MKICLFVCAALLLCCACALAEPQLIQCEFYEGGGMENTSIRLTLTRRDGMGDRLTVEEREGSRATVTEWTASVGALDDLDAYLAAVCPPAVWGTLPDEEFFALDAPSRIVYLQYDDGSEYSLSATKQLPDGCGPIVWNVRRFLESYAAAGAKTFAWSYSSFGGSGMTVTPVLSDPEKAYWTSSTQYETQDEPIPPGSPYRETFVFHGRVPGRVEVTMAESGAPVPVSGQDIRPMVLILEIDGEYNVTLVEPEEEKRDGGFAGM